MRMRLPLVVSLIFGSTAASNGDIVAIQGAANYVNGNPVAGATISLKAGGLSTKTDSNGVFLLAGTTAAVFSKQGKGVDVGPQLINNHLRIRVQEDRSNVRMEVFDLKGKACGTIVDNRFSEGNYDIPIDRLGLAQQVRILKAAIGSQVWLFRLPVSGGSSNGEIRSGQAGGEGVLRKVMAAYDTVIAVATDGATQRKGIDSASATVFFTFDNPLPGGNPADAALFSMPMVMPLVQVSCFRYCVYYTSLKPVDYTPAFNSDSLTYEVSFDSNVVVGIKPVARSVSGIVSVKLDNTAIQLTPWYNTYFLNLLGVFYTCTLSTPNQTRTFATTVTSGDNASKRTYTITMKR